MSTARHVACYQRWIAGQEASLGELEAASANAAAGRATDAELRAALERCMRGYAEYVASRRTLAREDSTALFAPPWCTSFENSVLWLGGCRPSLTIRLLYSLSGEGLEEHIEELISGAGALGAARSMGLLGITARQLEQVNDLHRRTLRDEDALSDRLATLQEEIADRPLLPIVRERATAAAKALAAASCDGLATRRLAVAGPPAGAVDPEVDAAIGSYKAGLGRLLEEADELRLSTARTLATEILTPRQAVDMLVAAKQLHLAVRDWSRRRGVAQPVRPPLTSPAPPSDRANP
ncbi:protein DOG1-like 1 [Oryza brachyantha]|uniref:protein DOG1-like 1 n=1 Tax=Oryza brachyantha TaxID=4533 RepID=UPI001ADD3502|nr:protein DOG1-like 1 [Oryza brachyantha]